MPNAVCKLLIWQGFSADPHFFEAPRQRTRTGLLAGSAAVRARLHKVGASSRLVC